MCWTDEMIGKRFGRLTVISETDERKNNRIMYSCLCDCGRIKIVSGSSLRNGRTKSCGCLQKESASATAIKLSTVHGLRRTRLYRIWLHMKERCNNPNCASYANYGGRGIAVCDEWAERFQAFYDWSMANGYRDDLTIDRIKVNGNYCPDNCRWITIKEQANNKISNTYITLDGVTHTMSEWSNITGINYSTIRSRHRAGMSPAEILSK